MSNLHKMEIEPNKPFAWSKGMRLIPNQDVTILFPGGLIGENETIGAVIEVSDEAEIGFEKSDNPTDTFKFIVLKVSKGDGIRLNRGTQAIVIQPAKKAVEFAMET
jgi:hypothetical protein